MAARQRRTLSNQGQAAADVAGYEDPLTPRGGLAIYTQALRRTARGAWVVPVLFPQTPALSPEQLAFFAAHPDAAQQADKVWNASGRLRWRYIRALFARYKRRDKERLRMILLRDGYLFVEDAFVARESFTRLTIRHFFDEPVVYLRRGDVIHELRRERSRYVYADGPRQGHKARLLIFDRLGLTREAVEEARAWDPRRLRPRLGLRAFEVQSVEHDLLRGVAHVDGETRVPGAAFLGESGALEMAVLVPEQQREAVLERVRAARHDLAINAGIIQAGDLMVSERLRFDEPRTEEGQQDGILRILWRHAYRRGFNRYAFNGDSYLVYTRDGQPNVPQVCIDFVYDCAERWSGAWWRPRGEARERTQGFLNFERLVGHRRQVAKLVAYAGQHPEQMDSVVYEDDARIPYRRREAFYELVEGWARDAAPSDIVVIYGLRADGRNHWHSFLVYDTDPLFNIPYLLIGNAGFARISTWHDTMRKAPRRAITHRIKLRSDWLARERAQFAGDAP